MSRPRYIVVNKWPDFQHYGKRDPIWIKNYLRLLHDDAYLELTGHQRAVLHGIWLIYASSGCQLRADTASLTRQLGLRVSSEHLKVLRKAGWIDLSASKPLAPRYAREEKRREEKPKAVTEARPEANGHGDFRVPEGLVVQ